MSFLEINGLSKSFAKSTPLKNISFTAEKGDVISIIGPSGTGKSTLIRCINRLETPTSGDIIIDGENVCGKNTDLTGLRKKVGMVFQSFNLFGHKNVLENIMMPQMDLLGVSEEEARAQALKQLKKVGLESRADRMPSDLSGGQKQRVAIARALAMKPQIMLFDEPTSALDPTMVSEVKNVIRRLAEDGMTMLIVTHEMRLARDVSTRVLYIDEGIVYEQGTPEKIFENPEKEKTRAFVKKISVWEWNTQTDGCDFFSMAALLEEFCIGRFMNKKQSNACEIVFEEAYTGYILPALEENDGASAEFKLEAENDNDVMMLKLSVFGTEKDVFNRNIDDISEAIIKEKSKVVSKDKNKIEYIITP